jgi:hypothetical protein
MLVSIYNILPILEVMIRILGKGFTNEQRP